MGTEEGDRPVPGLTTAVDGSAPHSVFVVFHFPSGVAVVPQHAFAVQIAVFVHVARSVSAHGRACSREQQRQQRALLASTSWS